MFHLVVLNALRMSMLNNWQNTLRLPVPLLALVAMSLVPREWRVHHAGPRKNFGPVFGTALRVETSSAQCTWLDRHYPGPGPESSLSEYFEGETPLVLLDFPDQVFPSLKSAFLYDFFKEKDLGLKDLERIAGREVAAAHAYPHHLHPNEPHVGLQEISDAQIRAANKDPSPPWCILVPSRVSDHLCCSLISKTSALLSLSVCIKRFWVPSLSRGSAVWTSLSTCQPPELRPKHWARTAPRSMDDIFFAPISAIRHRGGALHSLATCDAAPHLQ